MNFITNIIKKVSLTLSIVEYDEFSPQLKELLVERCLSSRPSDLKITEIVLQIFKITSKGEQKVKDRFFVTLLKDSQKQWEEHLQTVLNVCKREGGERAFFECVKTKKTVYYTPEILEKIIKLFENLINVTKGSLLPLSNCPPFDEEGEELLNLSVANPESLSRALLQVCKRKQELKQFNSTNTVQRIDFCTSLDSFTMTKEKATAYLTKLPDTHRSPLKIYKKIFGDLQHDYKYRHLSEIAKIVIIKLIVLASSRQDEPTTQTLSSAVFDELIKEIERVDNQWGEEILLGICRAPDLSKNISLDNITRCLNLLNKIAAQSNPQNQIQDQLKLFSEGEISYQKWLEFLENISPKIQEYPNTENDDFQEILARFRNDSTVFFSLDEVYLQNIERQYKQVNAYCKEWKKLRLGQLVELANSICLKANESGYTEEVIIKLVAIGRLGLFVQPHLPRESKKYPYSVQVLTVLGLLNFENGAIAQVKTGEGKSLTVTLLAFVLAKQGKRGHIITSSEILAITAEKEAAEFFSAFGIQTSHICEPHRQAKRFQAQILYGRDADFKFAIMHEMLHRDFLFIEKLQLEEKKRFDFIIIDELDNLTIDTAESSARTSYPMEITYDWVYVPILHFVYKNIKESEQNKLSSPLTIKNVRTALEYFLNGKYKDSVNSISDSQLATWTHSAYKALYNLKNGDGYVINPIGKFSKMEHEQDIVLVDSTNTGALMWGMQLSDGLHAFLKLKHDFIPDKETLIPLALSHAVFYQMYKCIYGLTGTLGLANERKEIYEIYGIKSFDVPTNRPCIRKDLPLKIFSSKNLYLETILRRVEYCRNNGRPILVLCENIIKSKKFAHLLMKQNIPVQVLNDLQEEDEEKILKKAGHPGVVTIATNKGTRGINILLEDASKKNGGLYVLITFYPDSDRVEYQGRGRAGRQGQEGTSEILMLIEELANDPNNDLSNEETYEAIVQILKKSRLSRTNVMKNFHLAKAKIERHLYSITTKFFENFGKFHEMIYSNNEVLDRLASVLSRNMKQKKHVDLSGLEEKDSQIAEKILKLMHEDTKPISWKIVLVEVGERLKDKVINQWSLDFYQKSENLFKESDLKELSNMETKFQELFSEFFKNHETSNTQIFENLESFFLTEQDNKINEIKHKIDNLYTQNEHRWKKMLDPSGQGLLKYLSDITFENLKL